MSELKERLVHIRAGVEHLVKERDEQRARVAKLASQIHDESGMLDVLRKRVADLERENKVLRTTQTFVNTDTGESKERIDQLVKEIDTCLSLLRS